jgi:hypothetical protein
MRKPSRHVILGTGLFLLQMIIDLNRKEWMLSLSALHNQIPFFSKLSVSSEPFLLSVGFTLIRAFIYTYLLHLITESRAYGRQFFWLHIFLFAGSGTLYLLKYTTGGHVIAPPQLNYALFFLTNTPFLFLASLPAYYYLYKPVQQTITEKTGSE